MKFDVWKLRQGNDSFREPLARRRALKPSGNKPLLCLVLDDGRLVVVGVLVPFDEEDRLRDYFRYLHELDPDVLAGSVEGGGKSVPTAPQRKSNEPNDQN